MWSRRDQLQAYQFLRRRLVSAITIGDANHPESPSSRSVLSTLVGVLVTALVLAGFAVYGMLRPGAATSWRSGGVVIVERESGARFVLDTTRTLHPALNYASARLFLGKPDAATVSVSQASLAGVPRGIPVGIDGAPDALPATSGLLTGPWSACSETSVRLATPHTPRVVAALGAPPSGPALADGQALVVSVPDTGAQYLVTDGRRFLLSAPQVATALGLVDPARVVPVGLAWLNAVPAGPDLAFIAVPDAGRPGPPIDGTPGRIGDVYRVSRLNGDVQYYVLVGAGLDRVTETEAQLIISRPADGGRGRILQLSPAQLAAAPTHRSVLTDRGYPARLPVAASLPGDTVAVCLTSPDGRAMRLTLAGAAPHGLAARAANRYAHPAHDGVLADEVWVTPGRAAVVRAAVSGGFTSSALSLVADDGVRYPVPGPEVLARLGYGAVTPQPVAAALLDLLPVGPALDPAAPGLHGTSGTG